MCAEELVNTQDAAKMHRNQSRFMISHVGRSPIGRTEKHLRARFGTDLRASTLLLKPWVSRAASSDNQPVDDSEEDGTLSLFVMRSRNILTVIVPSTNQPIYFAKYHPWPFVLVLFCSIPQRWTCTGCFAWIQT